MSTQSTMSSTATAAREGARHSDGKFGSYAAPESEVDLAPADPEQAESIPSPYAELKGDERVEAMKKDLGDAVQNLVDSGELHRYLDASTSNGLRRWSTGNRMLALVQLMHRQEQMTARGTEPEADMWAIMAKADCRTFKQWGEMDRAPEKGQRALYILAPVQRKFTEKDKATGEDKTRSFVAGFRPVPVFDVSQTDGEPMPQHPSRPFTGEVAQGTVEGLRNRFTELGYGYEEKEIAGTDPATLSGTLAYVSPREKKVVVDSRLTAAQKSQAMAHELGHIECGHVDDDAEDYRTHRGRMETEAEAFGYMMMRSRGATPEDSAAFSPGYIGGWSKGEPKTVQKALDTAGRAFTRSDEAIVWPEQQGN